MTWQYVTVRFEFYGPEVDDWPGGSEYKAALEAYQAEEEARLGRGTMLHLNTGMLRRDVVPGTDGARMVDDYLDWRETVQQEGLDELGRSGFELVSVARHETHEILRHDHTVRLPISELEVVCYFKRPASPDLPPPPTVGFRGPRDRLDARDSQVDRANVPDP